MTFALLVLLFSAVSANIFSKWGYLGSNSLLSKREEERKERFLRCRGGASEGEKEGKIKGPVIGIDLGTTYSCVAVWKNGRVEVCPNEQGNRITPSYVAWDSTGARLVGDAAKNQAASNPVNTVFDVKRLIGRKISDPSVQRDKALLPFKGTFEVFHGNIYSSFIFFKKYHLREISRWWR